MAKFKQEVDIPSNSVMIINKVVNDKRLGKTAKKRLTIAYIYGLLRRTFNLSLNDLKHHYLKKYNFIYCINRVSTLCERSGLSPLTIRESLKALDKAGYLSRITNRFKHLTYISLPLVLKNHIINPKIKAVLKNNGGTVKKQHSHRKKITEASLKNNARCSDSYVNDSNVSDSCCNVQKNKQHKKGNKKNISLINNWILNTSKYYGIPLNITRYVGKYLIKKNSSYKTATKIARIITNIKNKINTKYKGVYYSDYYKTETNPYIQKGGLIKSLNNVFDNNKDLTKTITNDYQNYINDNSNLKLRHVNNNNSLAYTGNDEQPLDKYEKAKREKDILIKGLSYTRNDKDKDKIQNKIEKEAKIMAENSDLDLWQIVGTKDYKSKHTLNKTSAEVQALVRKNMANLSNNGVYEDANGIQYASTNHNVFKPTKPKHYFDMNQF